MAAYQADDLKNRLDKLIRLTQNNSGGGGSATAANQVTGNNSLASIDSKLTTLNANSTNAVLSTVNSSTSPLGISGVFTGTAEEVTQYGFISIYVFSDVASATNGLSIQQSSDGTNWDIQDVYSIAANTGKVFSIPRNARYYRIVYTNGAVAQASFRLQSIYNQNGLKGSSVRPQDSRPNDNDMEEVLSYPMYYDIDLLFGLST